MARPTKYRKQYCKDVVELGKMGLSKLEMAHELGTTRMSFNRWERAHPEFKEAVEEAVEAGQAYWEGFMRRAVVGQEEGVNTRLLETYMRNRFEDWNTATKQEKTVNEVITIDHLDNVRQRIKLLGKRQEAIDVSFEELPVPSGGETSDDSGSEDSDSGASSS